MAINKPEVSKGFWITVGAILALLVLGLLMSLLRRASGKKLAG